MKKWFNTLPKSKKAPQIPHTKNPTLCDDLCDNFRSRRFKLVLIEHGGIGAQGLEDSIATSEKVFYQYIAKK